MGEQPKPWMNEPWPSGPLPQGNDCLRIQPDTCVDLTRLRTTPDGVEVKPEPASGGQGGFLDLRYPSHSMPPFREPADLATGVLDAMTRKLRDYDRLSAALTSAQAEATKNLERARLAEDERDSYQAAAESDAKEVDSVRDALRAASGESAADAARRAARTLFPWPGTVSHPLSASIDRMGGVLKKRPTEAPIDAAVRVMRELDETRAEVGRLRGQRDELEKQRDETGRKLCEAHQERDRLRNELDALRAAKPGPMLTPLRASITTKGPRYSTRLGAVGDSIDAQCGPVRLVAFMGCDMSVMEWFVDVGNDDYRGWYRDTAPRALALADVNAILARYGYVLEAWP